MRRLLPAAFLALVAVGTILVLRAGNPELVYTIEQTEAAFDSAGAAVDLRPSGVFLESVGDEKFHIMVLEDADKATWAYIELRRVRAELHDDFSMTLPGFELRRANVLVISDDRVSGATRTKIERALAQLGTS